MNALLFQLPSKENYGNTYVKDTQSEGHDLTMIEAPQSKVLSPECAPFQLPSRESYGNTYTAAG
jgi:hypothetical protein